MTGETRLNTLLASMSPEMMDGEYVFCTFEDAQYGDHRELRPVAAVREAEGLTLVIAREVADQRGIEYESVFRGITLQVHSSLDAVGLTAAVSSKLGENGISANVIAGYYHDHVFVPLGDARRAVDALHELVR